MAPHSIKGNGLYCYVTLNAGENPTGDLERDLKLWVRKQIGPIATPDVIQFALVYLKQDLKNNEKNFEKLLLMNLII